ncbi:MAG: glycosyltransferase family 2 protein [Oscillospiraceae bacterium]|nr:glycosyltransferase family 2 protein [Oscillospiraceae bacterium]
MEYLYILQDALVWVITIYWLYQIIISATSLIKLKDKPLLVNKEHKFMAVIPAHNESAVIESLIESLKQQNYPKELLDIYVIADNCTDNTAEVARKAGAKVCERFDESKKTKGYALQWFLNAKVEENLDYDAFCVFDADNIVTPEFFNNMNKKLCQGEEIVQGYRDIKNPTDTWVSAGYAIFYWTMNRFYHLARYNLGLSPLINGTGFMVKMSVLKEMGWNTRTLTEDIEFSLQNIIKGRKVGWALEAKVYDEQPIKFIQSWKQRERWTTGHIQCVKHYTKGLVTGIAKNKTLMSFDGFLYIFGIPMMMITLVLAAVNFAIYLMGGMDAYGLYMNYARYLMATFIFPIIVGVIIMALDKKPIRPMLKGLVLYPLFLGSWLFINIKCLIKPRMAWEKISHVRDIKINEIA